MRALLFSLIMLIGLGIFAPILAQERVIHIYNWSDYIDPKVLEDFTKETGIKVVYDVFDNNQILETKLLAGSAGYDVVFPSDSFLARQIQAGVFQKLDTSKLPNLRYMWKDVEERMAGYDPGNAYSINYLWGTSGIGYNVNKVQERLGDMPIDSWDVVFKPEIISKLAECGVYMLDAPTEMIPAALNYLGLNPRSLEKADLEKAADVLIAVRPYVRKFHSSEFINALANGDICLAVGWSGDVLQARNRAREAGNGVEIAYVIPKEGGQMWFDQMAIPADTKNVDDAHIFLNYMMRPDIAAKISNYVYFANGNISSKPLLKKEVSEDKAIYPDAVTMASLYTTPAYPLKVQRLMTRFWTKVKSGQ